MRKSKTKLTLGILVMLLGAILLTVGAAYPLIIAVLDNTPPEWILKDGNVDSYPSDGMVVVSLTEATIGVRDYESGVKVVSFQVDGGANYQMAVKSGDQYSGYWWRLWSQPLAEGSHTFRFVAQNNVGLASSYTGNFLVYTDLQGNWYVNDVHITSSAQTLYLQTLKLYFKFEKTSGIDDSFITCKVVYSGPQSGTLPLTYAEPSTWTGTKTFASGGKYTMSLIADDGTQTITFSLISFEFGGGEGVPITRVILVLSGLCLLFVGYFQHRKQIKSG